MPKRTTFDSAGRYPARRKTGVSSFLSSLAFQKLKRMPMELHANSRCGFESRRGQEIDFVAQWLERRLFHQLLVASFIFRLSGECLSGLHLVIAGSNPAR